MSVLCGTSNVLLPGQHKADNFMGGPGGVFSWDQMGEDFGARGS